MDQKEDLLKPKPGEGDGDIFKLFMRKMHRFPLKMVHSDEPTKLYNETKRNRNKWLGFL